MHTRNLLRLFAMIALCLCTVSCSAPKQPPPLLAPPTEPKNLHGQAIHDLQTLPQDLLEYAKKHNPNTPLVTPSTQQDFFQNFRARFFRPWTVSSPSSSLRYAASNGFSLIPEKGYDAFHRPFSMLEWIELTTSCNMDSYPSLMKHAITVANSNLRAMPTRQRFYVSPEKDGEGYPFDYFQHTAIAIGTPVLLVHASTNNDWALVETPFAAGWIPMEDIAVAEDDFKTKWQELPLLAITREKTPVTTDSSTVANIGAVFPSSGSTDAAYAILLPKRDTTGVAKVETGYISRSDASIMPITLTPHAVAVVGNEMMGQTYGWGGIDMKRDCSSMLRDLFTPFGLWLPRNSLQQARSGTVVNLAGKTPDEKEEAIIKHGTPFLSLIWRQGHIGLYVGAKDNKPLMFHDIWGLRVVDEHGSTDGRAIIGKVVVTTLRPGAELENINSPASLLDTIERLTNFP